MKRFRIKKRKTLLAAAVFLLLAVYMPEGRLLAAGGDMAEGGSSYVTFSYTDEDNVEQTGFDGGQISISSGTIKADDTGNVSNKLVLSKGTSTKVLDTAIASGKVHFETKFLTTATSGASLFLRILNSEGQPMVDIAQYGSSNMNLYLDKATSGDFAGRFTGLAVKKWVKAEIDIDLDKSNELGHLVFETVVWTTTDYSGDSWVKFAEYNQELYINSTSLPSKTGSASTAATVFDVAAIELQNAGSSKVYFDDMFFEAISGSTSKTLTELKIEAPAAKTLYYAGDALNTAGLVLKGVYVYTFEDGSTQSVESEITRYNISFDSSSAAENVPVTLSAYGASVSYYVTVLDNPRLEGIEEYVVRYVNNSLVALLKDDTIWLNKGRILLPDKMSENESLTWESTSAEAELTGNVLTVTPRADSETSINLTVTYKSINEDGDEVKLNKTVKLTVPRADMLPYDDSLQTAESLRNALEVMFDRGLFDGQQDLKDIEAVMKNLDRYITIEEVAAIIVNLFDIDTDYTDVKISRADVDDAAWYAKYVKAAFQLSVEVPDSREGRADYGIGRGLGQKAFEYMVSRIIAVDKTVLSSDYEGSILSADAGMEYEAGLPAQADSSDQLVEVPEPVSELPAFPGADGYAKYVTGGRGGKVIHVTNLNTTGEGSLAAALHNDGKTDEPRIIVFDVAGTIQLNKEVAYSKSIKNVTIAGQTAPGEGITLTGGNFYLKASENVIIRYIHFRHGQATAKDDSFFVQASKNIMIDHCSFTYGSDENCSARNTSNLTIQWSLISDGVRTHSMGGLQEWNSETIHHCLLGNHNDRNPKAKGIMDFTNNVVYNWGDYPFVAGGNSGGQAWGNVVNNYFIAGLDTTEPYYAVTRSNGKYFLYLAGNLIDSDKNGVLDGVNTGIDMIAPGTASGNAYPERFTFPGDYSLPLVLIKNRMNMPLLEKIDSAEEAYAKVLRFGGASLYYAADGTTALYHDDIDTQIIDGVIKQTGKILLNNSESRDENGSCFDQNYINSRGQIDANDTASAWYRRDTDRDGMPDEWETAHGLNPDDAKDCNNIAPSGYTWIEEYLNELAAPGFPEVTYSGKKETEEKSELPERTYILKLENYNGRDAEFECIYGENQIMLPFAPVAEYLGYKMLAVTENAVTVEYPYIAASGLLNLDTAKRVNTVKTGAGYYPFSEWPKPNELARSYNGMLYIPLNLVSLGMGAVYEQTIADETNNIAYITIHDAEVYKDWHSDNGIRNARKVSAPLMTVQYTDDGFKLVFDKEAAFAQGSENGTVSLRTGKTVYTAAVSSCNIWGSHKVASFKYSDFTDRNGNTPDSGSLSAYTLTVSANAFADYYNAAYVNEEVTIGVDMAAQKKELDAAYADAKQASDEIAGSQAEETGMPDVQPEEAEELLTVRAAVNEIYRLLSAKEINTVAADRISAENPAEDKVVDLSEGKDDKSGDNADSTEDGDGSGNGETSAQPADEVINNQDGTGKAKGVAVYAGAAAAIIIAAGAAAFVIVKCRGKKRSK